MATNVNTGQLDWSPLDRVFATAAAHGQRLIPVITAQDGSGCDGDHWQDPTWYQGGFKTVFNDPATTDGRGLTPLSYWTYLQDIVARYASSPALGMWEPISEAEASTCPAQYEPTNCSGHQQCVDEATAASALRYFFDTVGAEIRSLDPKHLIESGLLGGGQCGTQGSDYQYVSASPGIDVLSYHDYWGSVPIGGDQWNGMAVRLRQSVAVRKPIIAGETGLQAGSAPGCLSTAARNATFAAKDQAQAQAGSSGMLLWNWVPSLTDPCSYDIAPTDPVFFAAGAIG
jgi:mannan endo-1,4-beta-mannosidase